MKKLKCTSCGGAMTIDANHEYATCNYCGMKYKLNEDVNININVDDDIKNVFHNGMSHVGKFKYFLFIPIILFVIIVLINVFAFNKISNNMIDNSNFDESYKEDNEALEKLQSQQSIYMFNMNFETLSGTQSKFFVEILLGEVITSNQKNKNQLISVIYKENNTTDVNEIINIQKSLDSEKYIVVFDYDDKGYINKVTISE